MKNNIRKVKKFQKTLICLVVMLLMILSFIVGKITNANADDVSYDYLSSEIGYDSIGNSLNATNVKDAIDELYSKVGKCPNGYECLKAGEIIESSASNIVKAYTYDENGCITGNEMACKKTICYLSKNKNACSVGTIVDYRVDNLNTEASIVRFHVLHDDGETMTMQAQSNTVYNIAWWSSGYNQTKGPQTIMTALKTATDNWINVNPVTITSEVTSFIGVDSTDNLCESHNGMVSCSGNVYDIGLIANTYRARMITIQEATDPDIGQCLAYSESHPNHKSCRMFMNNYLYQSNNELYCKNTALCIQDDHIENGGEHNYGYWTMSSHLNPVAWVVPFNGNVDVYYTSLINFGARAVVVIDK